MPNATDLYLDLMKRVLTRSLMPDQEVRNIHPRGLGALVERAARKRGYRVVAPVPADRREDGRDWPQTAETMIGLKRLDNLQRCIETALADGVPGDLIETGVWRGGATIFMRAVLAAHNITDRTVWGADSFEGLPPPTHAADVADGGKFDSFDQLAVPLETVRANFERYGLLDDQVRFLVGWFSETLSSAPINKLAVARLDGDLYESTWDAIAVLYPKLSPGGFLIVDDYGCVPACAKAIGDFRAKHGITEPIEQIDWTGVFWRKHSQATSPPGG
jgi:O-methyltransferase